MKKKLNRGWKFWTESDSFALIWNVPENAEEINVPHDAMAHLKPSAESINGNGTGFVDGGVYYYVQMLEGLNPSKRYSLEFEGIYRNSSIYINGQYVGGNKFGYNRFIVYITNYLKFDSPNELRAVVRNNNEGSRWYAGGGINRDVYLLEEDFVYLEDLKFTTKSIIKGDAIVSLDAKLKNMYPTRKEVIVNVDFGETNYKFQYSVLPGGAVTIFKELLINDAKLWSDISPNLYQVEVSVIFDGCTTNHQLDFGIRTISCDYKNGLLINGQEIKLRGACIHSDSGILGSKTYFDYEYYKISKLKDAGFNAIRMSHNPISTAMLKACDILGMYIMDETFDMWHRSKSDYDFSLDFESDGIDELKLMINNDYNHPSVIMYSLGNEIPDIGMDKGIETLSKLAEEAKRLDNSRPTLLAINGVFAATNHISEIISDVLEASGETSGNVNNFMQVMDKHMNEIVCHNRISKILDSVESHVDILGYNYMYGRYDLDANTKRVIVGSETYPPQISNNWNKILNTPNVLGDFTWTGWDYIGEAGVGIPAYAFGEGGFGAKYPARLSYCGDFDLIGIRRPLSYFREIAFGLRKDPYITIVNPTKDQAKLIKTPWVMSDAKSIYYGKDNQELTAEVYSPGNNLKLFLNDELIANAKVHSNIAEIKFNYKPGVLKAISYQDDQVLGETTLASVSDNDPIEVEINKGHSNELIFINISDTQISEGANPEKLEITNIDGTLLGFGNGDPKNTNSYITQTSYTFDGHALLIVDSNVTKFTLNDVEYKI